MAVRELRRQERFSSEIFSWPIISHKDLDIGSPLHLRFTPLKVPDSCCFLACHLAASWPCSHAVYLICLYSLQTYSAFDSSTIGVHFRILIKKPRGLDCGVIFRTKKRLHDGFKARIGSKRGYSRAHGVCLLKRSALAACAEDYRQQELCKIAILDQFPAICL
jgi:hypothetical protein